MSKKFHVLVPGVWFLAFWFSVRGRCVLTWPGKGVCVEGPYKTQGGVWRDRITRREEFGRVCGMEEEISSSAISLSVTPFYNTTTFVVRFQNEKFGIH